MMKLDRPTSGVRLEQLASSDFSPGEVARRFGSAFIAGNLESRESAKDFMLFWPLKLRFNSGSSMSITHFVRRNDGGPTSDIGSLRHLPVTQSSLLHLDLVASRSHQPVWIQRSAPKKKRRKHARVNQEEPEAALRGFTLVEVMTGAVAEGQGRALFSIVIAPTCPHDGSFI